MVAHFRQKRTVSTERVPGNSKALVNILMFHAQWQRFFCNQKIKGVAILPSMAIYPQRLLYHELFVLVNLDYTLNM